MTGQTSVAADEREVNSYLSDPMDANSPLLYDVMSPNEYQVHPKAVAKKSTCPAIGDVSVTINSAIASTICQGSTTNLTFEPTNLIDVFNNHIDNALCILSDSNMEIIDDEGNVVAVIPGNSSGTFTYNPSALSPGIFQVQFNPVCEYGLIGNITGTFEVIELPNPVLIDDFIMQFR